jgi:hypothetical protein
MPDSWRNILERAAENLSIELDQERHYRLRQQSAGWPAPLRQPQRDQRQAAARPSKAHAAGPQAAMTQARPEKSRKRSPLGEFESAVISVAIVALTIYAIYNLLH